jgi:hypothetical protein
VARRKWLARRPYGFAPKEEKKKKKNKSGKG